SRDLTGTRSRGDHRYAALRYLFALREVYGIWYTVYQRVGMWDVVSGIQYTKCQPMHDDMHRPAGTGLCMVTVITLSTAQFRRRSRTRGTARPCRRSGCGLG